MFGIVGHLLEITVAIVDRPAEVHETAQLVVREARPAQP